jgi:hypothetical protein
VGLTARWIITLLIAVGVLLASLALLAVGLAAGVWLSTL